jgi:hypothetical protein
MKKAETPAGQARAAANVAFFITHLNQAVNTLPSLNALAPAQGARNCLDVLAQA